MRSFSIAAESGRTECPTDGDLLIRSKANSAREGHSKLSPREIHAVLGSVTRYELSMLHPFSS